MSNYGYIGKDGHIQSQGNMPKKYIKAYTRLSGGVISSDATWIYHTFIANGSLFLPTHTKSFNVEVYVIGGGGGGGSSGTLIMLLQAVVQVEV